MKIYKYLRGYQWLNILLFPLRLSPLLIWATGLVSYCHRQAPKQTQKISPTTMWALREYPVLSTLPRRPCSMLLHVHQLLLKKIWLMNYIQSYDRFVCICEILEPDLFVFVSLMQRRYSEPNAYTDSPPSDPHTCDDIYDDVTSTENEQEVGESRHAFGINLQHPLSCSCVYSES